MKKLAVILIFLFATATSAFAGEGFDPAQTPWGQDIRDTCKIFGITWEEGNSNLVIPGPDVLGYKSIIVHIYEDDKLACVSQMVMRAHNPELDDAAMDVLVFQMGQAYDKIVGSRLRDDLYIWIMKSGDYLILAKEGDRANLRRMPKPVWDKYWAHQIEDI